MIRFILSFIFIGCLASVGISQSTIQGRITNAANGQPVEFVTVYVDGTSNATESNRNGRYKLEVPSGEPFTIIMSRIGYAKQSVSIDALRRGQNKTIKMELEIAESDIEVVVEESKLEQTEMVRETVEALKLIPSTTGNFESILPSIALGTSGGTGGELSSQYNVRGGNYDENLVYVNDFEIFRPQLIRSSQQEGLSFPNPDLISNIAFSSGGFQSRFGDKVSSVLDIQYKRPDEFKGSVGFSFLGASAHLEGSKELGKNSYNKLRYLVGARYKTNRYLLGSLDTEGQYTPNFVDLQSYITYDISRDLQLAFIGNYNQSQFDFVPRERNTAFGSFFTTLRLSSVFEGQERDDYTNGMVGTSLTYIPERDKNPLFLKLLASAYRSDETETFDIQSFYNLAQVETGLGENSGDDVAVIGTGTQHEFARNNLESAVVNIQHRGGLEIQLGETGPEEISHFLQWGLQVQHEQFDDELNEWERLDSAGFSLPFDPEVVNVFDVVKSTNDISSTRFTGFFQNSFTILDPNNFELKATVGTRLAYWTLNNEFLVSPRAQLLYKPLSWDSDISFKLAGGVYYQPPFYRELRRPDGTLNLDLNSQRSIHAVAGFTLDFGEEKNNRKKYRFITEAYYKKLDNVISYEIDNIRIRYSGENDSRGYVAGLDFRINGELVPGVDSWLNVSLLNARETINDVQHLRFNPGDTTSTEVDFVPRPTDQLFALSLFFQDYLPNNENFKMHLNLSYGAGLPFGIEGDNEIFRNNFRYRAYQRVDIGFSLALFNREKNQNTGNLFSWSNGAWVSLEVFNLLDIENVASNTFIRTVFDQQFAIPNNLTSRRVNLRFKVEF